jgi:hypothetical protein
VEHRTVVAAGVPRWARCTQPLRQEHDAYQAAHPYPEVVSSLARQPRLYRELVPWYRLVDPPADHFDGAESYRAALERAQGWK